MGTVQIVHYYATEIDKYAVQTTQHNFSETNWGNAFQVWDDGWSLPGLEMEETMRAIDAVALSEGIELHRQGTDQEYESGRQWAVGYNAGLDRALYSIAYAKTIFPSPNDPLTLEELREMDGEPVWVVIAGMGRYAVIQHCGEWSTKFTDGMEPPNDRYGTYWLAYRRKLEEGTT